MSSSNCCAFGIRCLVHWPLFGSRLCLARWCSGGAPLPMGFKPPRHGPFGDRVVCAWVVTPASLTCWNGFVSLVSPSQATLCTALHAEFVCDKVGTPCLMGFDPLSASRQNGLVISNRCLGRSTFRESENCAGVVKIRWQALQKLFRGFLLVSLC